MERSEISLQVRRFRAQGLGSESLRFQGDAGEKHLIVAKTSNVSPSKGAGRRQGMMHMQYQAPRLRANLLRRRPLHRSLAWGSAWPWGLCRAGRAGARASVLTAAEAESESVCSHRLPDTASMASKHRPTSVNGRLPRSHACACAHGDASPPCAHAQVSGSPARTLALARVARGRCSLT